MTMSTQSTPGGGTQEAYKAQIDALGRDPNARPAYKQQLDTWLRQVEAAMGQAAGGSPPGGNAPVVQQPAPAGTSAAADPAAPSPETQTRQETPESATPPTSTGPVDGAAPGDVSSGGGVLSGGNVPQALKALAPQIEAASRATGVPQDRLAAVIWAESRGQAAASTTNGGNGLSDTGLMQINPATFEQLKSEHPDLQGALLGDPATDILAGAHLLADYHEQYGSWDLAQRAYNSGPGSVDVNDPNITTTGLGDPDYNRKVNGIQAALNAGQSLPA